MGPVRICYCWQVEAEIKKLKRKNFPQAVITLKLIGADLSLVKIKLEQVCKKKNFKLIRLLSYQAIGISFAFRRDDPRNTLLSEAELKAYKLPVRGRRLCMPDQILKPIVEFNSGSYS